MHMRKNSVYKGVCYLYNWLLIADSRDDCRLSTDLRELRAGLYVTLANSLYAQVIDYERSPCRPIGNTLGLHVYIQHENKLIYPTDFVSAINRTVT